MVVISPQHPLRKVVTITTTAAAIVVTRHRLNHWVAEMYFSLLSLKVTQRTKEEEEEVVEIGTKKYKKKKK